MKKRAPLYRPLACEIRGCATGGACFGRVRGAGGTHPSGTSKGTHGSLTSEMTPQSTLGLDLVRLFGWLSQSPSVDSMRQEAATKLSASRGSRCGVAPREGAANYITPAVLKVSCCISVGRDYVACESEVGARSMKFYTLRFAS